MNLGKISTRALGDAPVGSSRSDPIAVALVAAVVAVWASVAEGAFSLRTLLACEALFFSFYFAGSIVARWTALRAGVLFDLPLRLLLGYAVVNTALLALAWISPLGVVVNFALLFLAATAIFWLRRQAAPAGAEPASYWVIAMSLVATTLWCRDSIDPISQQGPLVVFEPWVDGFYHAVHVRIFAESHGASTIEDFRMTGIPARPYHYGMYMMPAFVRQAAEIHSYSAFAGILAPVGTFFTGLAAYACFGSLWGGWPGFAAAAALLLLPSGAQQGMQNPFMSYHWLTQISPSASYGLALLAVAWLFVIQGCTHGNRVQLLFGWLVAGVLAAYKLHFVVASALPLLLVPILFFRGSAKPLARALGAGVAVVAYVLALAAGEKVPGVPPIRFDGSAVGEILRLVQTFAMPGALKDFIVARTGTHHPAWSNLVFGIPYVLFAALGVLVPLFVLLLVGLRRRMSLLYLLFPALLILNFLAMFFGLALDFDSSTPDELSHRPIMIVHFFVVAWIGGALGSIFLQPAQRPMARPVMLGLASVLMVVPWVFGAGVQRMWAMPKLSPARLPASLVQVAEFIRTHGSPEDVFQDSQFDRTYALSALSERRTFVAQTMTRMPFRGDELAARTTAIDHLMALREPKMVVARARVFGFRWFVLQHGDRVHWPPEIVDRPALSTGAFKLYEF